jgi:anion-transporting  ArsA/GET3 family ATPase
MSGELPDPGSLESLLTSRRVVVCVGCGGVGKTTASAAMGLVAARLGLRALVLTIDPARRLADALGLAGIGNEPCALPRASLERLGVPREGELSAMMLDMKRTFDDLVQRFAPSEEERGRILANPIYQHVSDALAGSAEYSAMEKVCELAESEELDVIILDTPPAQHALDFLEAPARLLAFLDSPVVQLLLHPAFAAGRTGFRFFQRGAARVLRTLEKVTGVAFLEDISTFLLAFEGMSEGFRTRAHHVQELLFGPRTGFVLTAGPGREATLQGASLLDQLEATGVLIRGLVLNRVHDWPGAPPDLAALGPESEAALAGLLADVDPRNPEHAARAAIEGLRSYASFVERDARALAPLASRASERGAWVRRIPEFDRDVRDLESLRAMADHLIEAPETGADR